jgi:hypothetical protein
MRVVLMRGMTDRYLSARSEPLAHEKFQFGTERIIEGCLAAWGVVVVSAGAVGVLHSWRPYEALFVQNHMAILFGALLAGLVIAHYSWRARRLPLVSIAQIRQFCRRDSRAIYLLLFILVGAHQGRAILNGAATSGTANELQGYLAAGVCALLLIRCSGLLWLHVTREARAPQRLP